jgi:hypothetical protein
VSTPVSDVDPSRYTEGPERYIRFAEDVLELDLSDEQERILRALAEHERVLIQSGNGVGKSFGVAIAKLAFVATNLDSTVLGTSGSYSQYVDAVWRPMKQLHRDAKERVGLPGQCHDGGQPTLEIDADWFAKVVSPRDPGDLEGRHADQVLVIIEEADKAYIEAEHFDSAGSSVTDDEDRMIAICNPPRDETNIVAKKRASDRWHVIQFSTLDSHNVRVDAGEIDGEKIPGLTDLGTVVDDWEAWNDEPWPGLEQARRWSEPDSDQFREDLDERWYRRRAGVIPPEGAEAHRPFTREIVDAAWERSAPDDPLVERDAIATGVDVARSGDRTVMATVAGDVLTIDYERQGTNHLDQADDLSDELQQGPGGGKQPIAVDAVGEGSGLEDILAERFPSTIRFGAGSTPKAGTEFYDCWAEGLYLLGQWLQDGGVIQHRGLYEELMVAARVLEFEERHYASRGDSGAEVLKLTPKADLKERLGRSPDLLDAAMQAVWARDAKGPDRGVRSYYGEDADSGDQASDHSGHGRRDTGGVSTYYDSGDNS